MPSPEGHSAKQQHDAQLRTPEGRWIDPSGEEGEALRQKEWERRAKVFEAWKGETAKKIAEAPANPEKGFKVLTADLEAGLANLAEMGEHDEERRKAIEKEMANMQSLLEGEPSRAQQLFKKQFDRLKEEADEIAEMGIVRAKRRQEFSRRLEALREGFEQAKQGIRPGQGFFDALAEKEGEKKTYITTHEEERAAGLSHEQLSFYKGALANRRLKDVRELAEAGQNIDENWE